MSDLPSDDVFTRHRGPVASVAAAGPRTVVTGGYDGAVAAVDVLTGRFRLLGHHDHLVNRVEVDVTGRWVASCSSDHTVALWDLRDGRQVWRRGDHEDDVEAFAFLPDGRAASAGRDHLIVLRDPRTGEPLRTLRGHDRSVLTLAAADVLVSAGDDRTLRSWDPDTGELLATWGPFSHETDSCAIDARRRLAALGAEDGAIHLVSIDDGDLVASVHAHRSAVKALAIAQDGRLLSCGYDQRVQRRDLTPDLHLVSERTTPSGLWERTLTNGARPGDLLGGTFDGTVLHWPAGAEQALELGGDGLGNVCINDVAADGDRVALASDDGVVRLLQVRRSSAAVVLGSGVPERRVLMNGIGVDHTTHEVLTGDHESHLVRWALEDHQLEEVRRTALDAGPVNSVVVDDRSHAFVACYDGSVVEVTPGGDVLRRIHHHEGPAKAVRLHPNGTLAASCSADGSVCTWDTRTGTLVRRLRADGPIANDLAFSPDGSLLAVVGRDFSLTWWDLLDGQQHGPRLLGERSLKSVVFTADRTATIGDYWGGITTVDLDGEAQRTVAASNGISAVAVVRGTTVAASFDGAVLKVDAGGGCDDLARFMDQRPVPAPRP
jgi:WD40 repeat protein